MEDGEGDCYNFSLEARNVELRILFEPYRRERHCKLFKLKNNREFGKKYRSIGEPSEPSQPNQPSQFQKRVRRERREEQQQQQQQQQQRRKGGEGTGNREGTKQGKDGETEIDGSSEQDPSIHKQRQSQEQSHNTLREWVLLYVCMMSEAKSTYI